MPDEFHESILRQQRILSQDEKILALIRKIAQAVLISPRVDDAVEPRTLMVGGFVRDALWGLHPKDVDIEVYGVTLDALERILHTLFPGKVNAVGTTFGVYKIHHNESECDVALPRRESKTGPGHKGFAIEGDPTMPPLEAARRRDFTYNALMADPVSGKVFDFYHGLDDLEKNILRIVDAHTFQEDPLRVYRAVQFVGRFKSNVDSTTFALMKTMVERGDLATLSPERVTEEIKKLLLKSEQPSRGFALMRELGIIEKYFPELAALQSTEQEPEWHPEGNVWIHSMMVIDHAAQIIRRPESTFSETEKLQIMLGALCHDLGKPSTTRQMDGRIRSHNHSEEGEEPTRIFLEKCTFGKEVNEAAVKCVLYHLQPGMFLRVRENGNLTPQQYENAVRKLIRKMYPVSWRVLLAVAESDHRGRAFPDASSARYEAGELFTKTVREKNLDNQPTKPLVSGQDVLDLARELGVTVAPGPRVGELVRYIEELRDEGEVKTREDGLEELKKLLLNNDQ